MLERLFNPKSIAVIGASRTPGKIGHDILYNIMHFGYTGAVYPVNPNSTKIAGLPTYPTVAAIRKGKSIDLAIIVVPADQTADVLEQCGQARVRFAMVISSGFKEVDLLGEAREAKLQEIAHHYGIRLIGPNCLGLMNTAKRLNASFASGLPQRGGVSVVTQSGAMGVALLDWAYSKRLGFAKMLSLGNKADITEIDCLDYLAHDHATKVILLYLEDIRDGRRFVEVASRITPHKPIVLLKAGRSQRGKQAVTSHTGALAGERVSFEAACRRAGIIVAKTVEAFFDLGLGFAEMPLPQAGNVAIITNAGGPGIMAIDALEGTALTAAELPKSVQTAIARHLPKAASTHNPVDLIGDATSERYAAVLDAVLGARQVDAVIVILTPQVMTDEDQVAQTVAQFQRKHRKPVLASFMGAFDAGSARIILDSYGIPQYDTPERAVAVLDTMVRYAEQRVRPFSASYPAAKTPHTNRFGQLRTIAAEALLKKAGLPVLRSRLVKTAADCAHLTSFPLVMKVASRSIIHKAAAGCVVTNIDSKAAAKKAFAAIKKAAAVQGPDTEFEGVLVQPQLQRSSDSRELIIGMTRDPQFGPVVLVGLGGSFVETIQDTAVGLAPLGLSDAKALVQQLQSRQLLHQSDTTAIADALVRLARLALQYPQIDSMEINPMIVYPLGGPPSQCVDVRVLFAPVV